MKRLILGLSFVTVLSGCAQLKDWYQDQSTTAGAGGSENARPYPKSSSDLGLF